MLDIDYSNMSASELETAYNEAVNQYNAENKVNFEEDEYIDDEDYIPFQESMDIAEQNEDDFYDIPENIRNQELSIINIDNKKIKDKKQLEKYIQGLIDENIKDGVTQDGHLLSFVNSVYTKGKNKRRYRVASHLARSSKKFQPKGRENAVFNILNLIKNSVFVEKDTSKDNKRGYDFAIRFYSAVRLGNKIYPVRIVALHNAKTESLDLSGDVYDVIFENTYREAAATSMDKSNVVKGALPPDKIIISDLLKNVKSSENKLYRQADKQYRGAYYKDVIYLFQKANASTFMHETAHWFKEELKKFGSEKSAMMLKKVDEWENEEFVKRYSVALDKGRYVVKNNKKTPRDRYGDFFNSCGKYT